MFVFLLFFSSLSYAAEGCGNDLDKMTPMQKSNFWYIYNRAKPFGEKTALAMVAIAWNESCLGLWPMNLTDGKYGSFGLFHNLAESVLKRHDMKVNGWNASRIGERLVFDKGFSFAESLEELKYWENVWRSKGVRRYFHRALASYNAGWKWKKGKKYAKKIEKKMRLIEKYLIRNGVLKRKQTKKFLKTLHQNPTKGGK